MDGQTCAFAHSIHDLKMQTKLMKAALDLNVCVKHYLMNCPLNAEDCSYDHDSSRCDAMFSAICRGCVEKKTVAGEDAHAMPKALEIMTIKQTKGKAGAGISQDADCLGGRPRLQIDNAHMLQITEASVVSTSFCISYVPVACRRNAFASRHRHRHPVAESRQLAHRENNKHEAVRKSKFSSAHQPWKCDAGCHESLASSPGHN